MPCFIGLLLCNDCEDGFRNENGCRLWQKILDVKIGLEIKVVAGLGR